jgi:hypothetical protein
MTTLTHSIGHEWQRFRFRVEILWRGVIAVALWFGIAVAWSILPASARIPAIAAPLVLLAIAGFPVLVVQLGLIVDLLLFAVAGQISFYPAMLESLRDGARRRAEKGVAEPWEPSSGVRTLVWTVDALSPFAMLALWSFCVLARMPESTHATTSEHSTRRHSPGRSLRRVESSLLTRSWRVRSPVAA